MSLKDSSSQMRLPRHASRELNSGIIQSQVTRSHAWRAARPTEPPVDPLPLQLVAAAVQLANDQEYVVLNVVDEQDMEYIHQFHDGQVACQQGGSRITGQASK